jgi:hypothetical protein
MEKILNIFKAPWVTEPDPEVTHREVAIAYALVTMLIAKR